MKNKLVILALCFTLQLFGEIPTYFDYSSEELERLRKATPTQTMNNEQLKQWDGKLSAALARQGIPYFEAERITTYLYVAQAEAAALSHNAKGEYAGSLDPVSNGVLRFFIPGYGPKHQAGDSFSETLRDLVLAKIKARAEREDEREIRFEVPEKQQEIYTVGLRCARWTPWHLGDASDYWPDSPPSPRSHQWKEEVTEIKKAQSKMTEQQREAIYRWAGRRGPHTGNWIVITNHYLFKHAIPFGTSVQVRAAVLTGLYDAAITFFGAKYRYLVDRPQVYDRSVHYEIQVPAHPSYPSGHSTEAGCAATILSYYFPQDKEKWERLAEESCLSRIWGGIHYPIDDWAGRESGERIGNRVIRYFKKNGPPSS